MAEPYILSIGVWRFLLHWSKLFLQLEQSEYTHSASAGKDWALMNLSLVHCYWLFDHNHNEECIGLGSDSHWGNDSVMTVGVGDWA